MNAFKKDICENQDNSSSFNNNPKFIIYKVNDNPLNANNLICSICKKEFNSFYNFKRHMIQVELNIKKKCKYCKGDFKRIDEHLKHCKVSNNTNLNLINNNLIDKGSIDSKISNVFDPSIIIKNIIPDLTLKYKNSKINDNFIYFPELKIGEGSFGTVLFGINIENYLPVAIKVQNKKQKKDLLENERKLMEILPNNFPFPKVYYHNFNLEGNLLIQTLCGPSLNKLYKFCKYSFDIVTISNIAIDLIKSLEVIHFTGYTHLDIKDDNIVILLKDYKNFKSQVTCIFIDFGKAFKIKDNENNNQKSYKNKIFGNYRYASINILKNGKPNEWDDIESMLYLLLELYYGELPWANVEKKTNNNYIKEILKSKEQFDIEEFCDDSFEELKIAFKIINQSNHKDKPDYSYIKSLFEKAVQKYGGPNYIHNFRFKWENLFYYIYKQFIKNNDLDEILDVIDIIFKGFPEKFVLEYLKQYYYNNN